MADVPTVGAVSFSQLRGSIILYRSKPFVSKTNNINSRVKQRREAIEVPPQLPYSGENFVVISLDTEIGKQRRDGLCLPEPYLWSRGVLPEEVPDFVKEHWYPGHYRSPRRELLMGAFAAHLQAWQTVAAMGSPAITILEDDAKFVHPIPEGFPEDKITLLGGVFKGYGKWDGPAQRAYAEGKFIEEFAEFNPGVNEIPKGMRWVMAVAYHLPTGMAKKLVDIVDGTDKEEDTEVPRCMAERSRDTLRLSAPVCRPGVSEPVYDSGRLPWERFLLR